MWALTVLVMLKRTLYLLVFLATLVWLLANPSTTAIAVAVLVLLSMVAVHEAGHLVAARLCGVDAPEFSVGFGPLLAAFTPKSGKTRYVLRAIPLGGYVRITGLGAPGKLEGEDDPTRAPQGVGYEEISRPKRIFISAAGPLANIFTAVLILLVVFLAYGQQVPSLRLDPQSGSPAAMAGIKEGDLLVSIDGTTLTQWEEIPSLVKDAADADRSLTMVVENAAGSRRTVEVTPTLTEAGPRVGIAPIAVREDLPFFRAVTHSFAATKDITKVTLTSFGNVGRSFVNLPTQLVTGETNDAERVVSPIGAARLAEQSARRDGWMGPASLAASISIFVALFNLLPLPPLDGSHIATAMYEGIGSRIRRKEVRVNADFTRRLATLTTLVVLFMGVGAILLDILHPIMLP